MAERKPAKKATRQSAKRTTREPSEGFTAEERAAPKLTARLWYGMPAYAKDGNVVCFFQDAQKFKSR